MNSTSEINVSANHHHQGPYITLDLRSGINLLIEVYSVGIFHIIYALQGHNVSSHMLFFFFLKMRV